MLKKTQTIKNGDEQMMKGVQKIRGILNSIIFETNDEEFNEDSKIDLITLDIDGRLVFVYPYSDLIKVSELPPFLTDFTKKYEIIMTVRTYGTHLIALDTDFLNALFGLPKVEFDMANAEFIKKSKEAIVNEQ